MIAAERHKKVSLQQSSLEQGIFLRSEDILTSHAFGLLRYLPHELGFGLLLRALSLPQEGPVSVTFWCLEAGTEPDILLETPSCVVLVEVKLHAAFSEGQLAREWQYLVRRAPEKRRLLVTLLPSAIAPSDIVAQIVERLPVSQHDALPTLSEVSCLTWSELGRIVLLRDGVGDAHIRAVREDFEYVLTSRGLFGRFEHWPATYPSIPRYQTWYQAGWFKQHVPDASTRNVWRTSPSFMKE